MEDKIVEYLKHRAHRFQLLRAACNDKIRELGEMSDKIKEEPTLELNKDYEYDHMYLLLLQTDKNRTALEFNVVKDLAKKLEVDFTEEVSKTIEDLDVTEMDIPYEHPTFTIKSGEVVERDSGIVKVKLDLVRKSEAYKQMEELKNKM